jgi:hypothetical protein
MRTQSLHTLVIVLLVINYRVGLTLTLLELRSQICKQVCCWYHCGNDTAATIHELDTIYLRITQHHNLFDNCNAS